MKCHSIATIREANLPDSKLQDPQFLSSVLSVAPQSLTKSQTLLAGMHLFVDLHLTAHGLGEGDGVGAERDQAIQ